MDPALRLRNDPASLLATAPSSYLMKPFQQAESSITRREASAGS